MARTVRTRLRNASCSSSSRIAGPEVSTLSPRVAESLQVSIPAAGQAMTAYAKGELGEQLVTMPSVDRIIAIGSDRMMAAVAESRHTVLKPYLKPGHCGIGSINSPMQCMMKEICAQCLQPHRDPQTGETRYVFSCFNQDQHMDSQSDNSQREELFPGWPV